MNHVGLKGDPASSVCANPAALEEGLDEYVRQYETPGVLRSGFEYYRALVYRDGKDNREDFKRKLPMLVLGVAAGRLNAGLPEARKACAADVRPLVVEHSGHFIPEERPVYLANALMDFFDEDR